MTLSIKVRGDRVSDLRSRGSFSQAGLTKALNDQFGVDIIQSTISHIETGRKQPSIEVLVALARLFNTSVDYLVGLRDDDSPPQGWDDEIIVPIKEAGMKPLISELISLLSQANADDLRFYLDVIKKMSNKPPRIIGGE